MRNSYKKAWRDAKFIQKGMERCEIHTKRHGKMRNSYKKAWKDAKFIQKGMERCEIHTKRHGEMRNSYKILVRKSYGCRSLGRSRCRWKDNKNVDFKVTGYLRVEMGLSAPGYGGLMWKRQWGSVLVR